MVCAILLEGTGQLGASAMLSLFRGLAVALFATLTFISEAGATEWRVSLWGEPRAFTKHVERLAELVEQRTGGGFSLKIFYGGLASSNKNLDGVIKGDFEMAQACVGYHPKQLRTLSVLELPFLGISTLEQERRVSQELYRHRDVVAEMEQLGIYLLMPSPLPQYNLAGTGAPPVSVNGFRNLNVRALGSIGEAVESFGAIPTYTSINVLNNRLDSGAVHAASLAPHTLLEYNVLEHSDWWTKNLNPGTANCPVAVNRDALDKLSSEHRRVLLESVDEALDQYIEYYNDNATGDWEKALQDHNVEIINLDQNVLDHLHKGIAEDWIRSNTAAGVPAGNIYSDMISILRRYHGHQAAR